MKQQICMSVYSFVAKLFADPSVNSLPNGLILTVGEKHKTKMRMKRTKNEMKKPKELLIPAQDLERVLV